MELYLIRHGIAAPRDGTYPDDRDRPLTDPGRQKTHAIAQRLKTLQWRVDHLRSSPLVRAWQTAEILLETGLCPQIDADPTLAPDGHLDDWLDWYAHWPAAPTTDRLAIVGHEPNLSEWTAQLMGNAAKATIALKKAGIIGLALPEEGSPVGRSQLFWLTPPRLFL
jgi:phosphohistidine phosphatase